MKIKFIKLKFKSKNLASLYFNEIEDEKVFNKVIDCNDLYWEAGDIYDNIRINVEFGCKFLIREMIKEKYENKI